jgi:hypothetical protein
MAVLSVELELVATGQVYLDGRPARADRPCRGGGVVGCQPRAGGRREAELARDEVDGRHARAAPAALEQKSLSGAPAPQR